MNSIFQTYLRGIFMVYQNVLKNLRASFIWAFLLLFSVQGQPAFAGTYTVTNTADSGSGSLRQAIDDANLDPGSLIAFNIPGAGPHRIQPITELPIVIVPTLIDGYTQPGTSVNTLAEGTNAVLLIELNGSTVGATGINSGIGIALAPGSNGSIVKGLVINQWLRAGIGMNGIFAAQVLGNFIGTNVDGTEELANTTGVLTQFSLGANNIGGTALADRNLIVGSFFHDFLGGAISMNAGVGGIVINNLIGTDRTGSFALGNTMIGVHLRLMSDVIIGGPTSESRNIISGCTEYGIRNEGSGGTLIQNNYIGTNVSGKRKIANAEAGIELDAECGTSSTNCLVKGNLISGNGNGIIIGSKFLNSDTIVNNFQANLIGTDVTGTKSLGNEHHGVIVIDRLNSIGGPTAAERNIISGNGENGILITNAASITTVIGNYIGTDITGQKRLGNGANGIQIGLGGAFVNSLGNIIGGSIPGIGNVISGNNENGIKLQSFSSVNLIKGNLIGVAADGTTSLGNHKNGILIDHASNNIIGGNSVSDGNIIAHNFGKGVEVGEDKKDTFSIGNIILTNSIFANKDLGIDLHKKGAPFERECTSEGPNHFQTSPKLKSALVNGNTTVEGVLCSVKNSSFTIQFFSTPSSKPGSGKTFLGSVDVTTNSKGKAKINAVVDRAKINEFVTATATLINVGPVETSEFSNPVKVTKS